MTREERRLPMNTTMETRAQEGFAVHDPATGAVVGHAPDARVSDVGAVMARAAAGFAGWRATPPRTRATALHRAADLLIDRADALARTLTAEMGKPLAE